MSNFLPILWTNNLLCDILNKKRIIFKDVKCITTVDWRKEMDKAIKEIRENEEYSLDKMPPQEAIDLMCNPIEKQLKSSIENLKHMISENAKLYCTISNTKEIKYNSIEALVKDINGSENIYDLVDRRNFSRSIESMDIIKNDPVLYMSADTGKPSTIKNDEKNVCFRNLFIQVKYENKNTYTLKTFSTFYAYYLIINFGKISDDTVTFQVHNSLYSTCEKIYNNFLKTQKEKILFLYLVERGTGLGFKKLLYDYAQKFYEMAKSKSDYIYFFDTFLKHMTLFKSVCLFPSDALFNELYKVITILMDAYLTAAQKNFEVYDESCFYKIFIQKLDEIAQELFAYQTEAISKEHNTPEEYKFPDYKFEKEADKAAQHVQMWEKVQRFVDVYVNCDNPSSRFDINIYDYSDTYKVTADYLLLRGILR